MNELFKKLQYKGSERILVLNAPPEFLPTLEEVRGRVQIDDQLQGEAQYDFVLVFVKACAEVAAHAAPVVRRLNDDAVLWFAYPKKSSKRYKTDLGRDGGWQPLGDLGYEGVRIVAIDADWSALRLRHVSKIKTFSRHDAMVMSDEGKNRKAIL